MSRTIAIPKTPTAIRFNPADIKIIDKLKKKFGVGMSDVLRLAIRALADKEGLTV